MYADLSGVKRALKIWREGRNFAKIEVARFDLPRVFPGFRMIIIQPQSFGTSWNVVRFRQAIPFRGISRGFEIYRGRKGILEFSGSARLEI